MDLNMEKQFSSQFFSFFDKRNYSTVKQSLHDSMTNCIEHHGDLNSTI